MLLKKDLLSSVANEVIRTISDFFIFFYEKKFSVKKHQNAKQTIFTLLEVFGPAKTCCLCCFLSHWFWLVTFFVRLEPFCKKNKQVWNCPDNLIHITTDVCPDHLTYREFICSTCVFLSVRIYFHLYIFVWILKHQKRLTELWILMFYWY